MFIEGKIIKEDIIKGIKLYLKNIKLDNYTSSIFKFFNEHFYHNRLK